MVDDIADEDGDFAAKLPELTAGASASPGYMASPTARSHASWSPPCSASTADDFWR
jgi:hypothetical protein